MAELIKIPIAIFEYTGEFSEPIFTALMDRAKSVQAVYNALSAWEISLDDVEPLTTGKAAEQGISFKLKKQNITFFYGAGSCRLTKTDSNWESAPETIRILNAAWSALKESTGAIIATQKTTVALHLQLTTRKYAEVLEPFLPQAVKNLESSPARTGAAIVKWEKRRIVLDGSGSIANGIFVRFERDFDGDVTYDAIAEQLHSDESAIFEILDVSESPS